MKHRCLFGIFPVWMQFYDESGTEINEMTGFWSDLAIFIDLSLDFIANLLSFGQFEREGFCFWPYEANGCKYWYQMFWKILIYGPGK